MEWNSMIEFDYTETITGPQIKILREGLEQSELSEEQIKEQDNG
jgi:hypothetical protein